MMLSMGRIIQFSVSIERSWAAVVCEGNVGLCPTHSAMHLFGSLLRHGIVSFANASEQNADHTIEHTEALHIDNV